MTLKLSYDEPYIAYALRIIAWQKFVARDPYAINDDVIESILHRVLDEFGGVHRSTPTIYNYTKDVQDKLNDRDQPKDWDGNEWYLLYAPFHRFVRELSLNPVVQGPNENSYDVTLRDPAIPPLRVSVGNVLSDSVFEENRQVIYILRHEEDNDEKMYIGVTDNDTNRMRQHIKEKSPHWWFIAQPLDHSAFDTSVQNATETMLTAFWNEIACVSNERLGDTILPNMENRLFATLLTSAISAAYLWFIREEKDVKERLDINKSQWEIPLKTWHRADFDGHYIYFKSERAED